jgi:hypothetical protein
LIVGTADDTVDRLAVGNNDETLTADSSTPTGLKWVAVVFKSLFTTKGDIAVATAASTPVRKGVGADGYRLVPTSGATDGLAWAPVGLGFTLDGGYIEWSTSGNVLTAAIKTWAGADPSDASPVFIALRSATAGTGLPVYRKITAATSISINNTALLGTTNSVAFRLWCVAFDDAGTIRLGVINCLNNSSTVKSVYGLSAWGIASSTQEGDGADSAHVFYTDGAAVSGKAYVTLGYATWESGLAAAGVWSADPTREELFNMQTPLPGREIGSSYVQLAGTSTGTPASGVPADDTIPQISEGLAVTSTTHERSSAANLLDLEAVVTITEETNAGDFPAVSIFQDSDVNALVTGTFIAGNHTGGLNGGTCRAFKRILAGASGSVTFSVRAGLEAAALLRLNGYNGAGKYSTAHISFVCVREIMA